MDTISSPSPAPRWFYRDFDTGTERVRWTRKQFIGWTGNTGPLGVKYAHFAGRGSGDDLFVPVYLLTPETKKALKEV